MAATAKAKLKRKHQAFRTVPTVVNVHEAKTQFSKLLARVGDGETITIAKHNVPVARLGPIPTRRILGTARGQFTIPDDFDAPMPDFEAEFYGENGPDF